MAIALDASSQAPARVRVAGFWRRMTAGLIDGSILMVFFVLLQSLVALILGQPIPHLSQIGPDYFVDIAVNGHPLAATALVISLTLGFLYYFIFHALRGQTPGKRLCGLTLIDGYGERPSLLRALARTAAYIPSALLLGLGFFWIAFDREKRGLHDWLADTYVVTSIQIRR